jgi:flagellar biogenesis protein FliO
MDPATLAAGPSYWQVGAALAAVLGLLVVVLKLLQRWQGAAGAGEAVRLLSVRRLGPRRELQVLQVGAKVHTIYRHDSAMVLLDSAPAAAPAVATVSGAEPAPVAEPALAAAPAPATEPASTLAGRLRALVAAAGGGSKPAGP